MHVAFNPEVFRRNPKLGAGLVLILLAIAVCGFYVEYRDYRSLGTEPSSLTIEQAIPSPSAVGDGPRWVRLTESLVPDCQQALQETNNGVVTGTRVLASDAAKERWVYVRLKGNVNCDAAAMPMQGILRKADSALPSWLKDHGMTVPASVYPLMEISTDDDPKSVLVLVYIFAGMGVLGIAIVAVFVSLGKAPNRRPVRAGTLTR